MFSDRPRSCRKPAFSLGKTKDTIWRWRMLLLAAVGHGSDAKFGGIVEVDETHQRESRKESREPDNPVLSHSPVGRVPTLVDGDLVITEAVNVVHYLEDIARPTTSGHELPPNWPNTMQEGLILGFMDGIACWIRENRRPAEHRSAFLVQVEHDRSERCLVRLEHEAGSGRLGDFPAYRFVALAVGLGLMGFHNFHMHWRRSHPALASWFEVQAVRQSMRETVPV